MATHVFRGIQRVSQVLDVGIKSLHTTLRNTSTLSHTRILTTAKNEKIILPELGDISYPEILIPDFVWSNSESYPNHIALECSVNGKKYTYAQAKDASSFIGRSLLNMGLKKDDVIVLVAPNFPDTILGLLGSLSAGLVVTTMNPTYTTDEMSRQLLKTNAKAVITSTTVASVVLAATKACLPPGTPFIVIDDKTNSMPDGSILFDDLITRGKSLPPVNLSTTCNDVAILPFSSGTTGLPKGVMLTHSNIVANIKMVYESNREVFRNTTDTYQSVIPVILPFFHIYGLNAVALMHLTFGGRLVTIPKFTPELFLNTVEKCKATILYLVPPLVLFLSNSSLVKRKHFEYLHLIMSGAAPMAKSDIDQLYNKFNIDHRTLRFRQGYGLTESSPVSFVEKGEKFASIGKNVKGCEARLVDIKTEQDVGISGQTGELWIRGPHIMKGYFNDEAATKATITEDNWLRTGDIAYFDEDFDFYITDRLKELIKVKGYQVPPAELEALLRTHPDVEEAAVIGIPHARYGEIPKAFVVVGKGKKPTEADIKNFVKGKVSDYKELEGGVTFINEIPKNASGKILRTQLKNKYKS